MFLFQKLGYEYKMITSVDDFPEFPSVVMFDTETTGLNFMKDVPFLITFGWQKSVFGIDLLQDNARELVSVLYGHFIKCKWVFAHNMKYDYHIMTNFGLQMPEEVNIADSQTVARLTNFSDEQLSKSLETMGVLYVDSSAKFAGKVIRTKINELNKERRELVKDMYKMMDFDAPFTKVWEDYKNRIQFVKLDDKTEELYRWFDECYQEANYLDVYKAHPNLMINYAFDDIVIMAEWLGKAIPILKTVDPELTTFKRECALIRPTASQERVGFKVDIDYLLNSKNLLATYQKGLYDELHNITGINTLTVGQHAVIKALFARKYNLSMTSVDNKTLSRITKEGEAQRVIFLIKKLRTVDKWLGTYVNGLLNRVVDGRIYTSIDLSGTVSGRVSSDMQQQPQKALTDGLENNDGNELYHPRRAIVADDDYELFFFDYSQQELRVQAYYTLLTSAGDVKLNRAYMPFKCTSMLTDEEFDYKDPKVLARWGSGEWLDEKSNIWTPTDVHAETTFIAFPQLNHNVEHPDFKRLRKLGKMCNFLKNYQGGIDAIVEQLDVSEEVAKNLDQAYYKAFPMIRAYQSWTVNQLHKVGFVENLYGRRYYMRRSGFFYKATNYLVQGSSADMVKEVTIKVDKATKGTKSSMIMPIHDEIVVRIHKDEKYLVPIIKAIMEDVPQVPWVPMISEVESTATSWADKKGVC